VRTLKAAITSGRHVHAYLFTGPRGVGKTSVARLLARALGCTGDPKPCNQCPGCLTAINSSLDIIEIDGASNRSIDAVRDLREKVNIAPTQSRYKVYIIDEVHMLTSEAFNALLKTLEEPPAHAVFILATTEAHKVPETIISRTQRYNFHPISAADIVAQLGRIAEKETIKTQPEALEMIAAAARGSFRDAIGLLDQLSASGTAEVTPEAARTLLGYSPHEEIIALSRALASHDAGAALAVTARFEQQGAQTAQVTVQLTEFWRQILHAAAGGPAPASPAAAELAKTISPREAARVVDELLEVSRSQWPALSLETALVKLTSAPTPAAAPPPTQAGGEAASAGDAKAPSPEKANSVRQPAKRVEAVSAGTPVGEDSAGAETSSSGVLDSALWPKVLVLIKSRNNSLAALLQMYPTQFSDGEVIVKPRFNFHRDIFNKPTNRALIEAAAAKVYGRAVKVTARTDEAAAGKRTPKADPNAELLSSALEILGGEVVE
jgi:DNA polymerase III subunit gamma/tau